jgi:uncharacterized protein (UPF0276 family)
VIAPVLADDASACRAVPAAPKLGIGLSYQVQMRPFMEARGDRFDFIEVVPEVVRNDLGPGRSPRYVDDPGGHAFLAAQSRVRPIIPHSIGLSIGSAHRFDREHLAQMARWHEWLRFPWHSDHLAFHLAEGAGGDEVNLNLTMPLPLDRGTLELVAARVAEVRRAVPAPFLLENNVYYFEMAGQDYDEAAFLNELHRASGCGLLLDLHNLHVNATNLGWNAHRFLDRLDLDAVVEVHVAGGMEFEGFYLDAHSGTIPRPVWTLLESVLPRCRNLGGVVFELFGTWYGKVGEEALLRQLDRLKERWVRHQPSAERVVA